MTSDHLTRHVVAVDPKRLSDLRGRNLSLVNQVRQPIPLRLLHRIDGERDRTPRSLPSTGNTRQERVKRLREARIHDDAVNRSCSLPCNENSESPKAATPSRLEAYCTSSTLGLHPSQSRGRKRRSCLHPAVRAHPCVGVRERCKGHPALMLAAFFAVQRCHKQLPGRVQTRNRSVQRPDRDFRDRTILAHGRTATSKFTTTIGRSFSSGPSGRTEPFGRIRRMRTPEMVSSVIAPRNARIVTARSRAPG